ncbi:MAG TPA: alpha/beta fold hydrolase [Clostridia bacterium]|nr:alpha/beta fold hydrolase [Clostridia bacterium]
MQLHFQVRGSGDPVIVLHGLFGSLDNWQSFNARLAGDYQVYGVDQPNHGRSPHISEMSYPSMAGHVARWMQTQNIRNARVIGHSMGGKTAMQLALDHPHLVRQLVIVDISPGAIPPRHTSILEGLQALHLPSFKTRKQIEDALAPWVPDLAVRQFLLKNVTQDEHLGFTWRIGLAQIAANYHRIGAAIQSSNQWVGPALFVRGAGSDYLSPGDLPLIREYFPKAQIEVIPDAGHWVHVEAPERFFQLIHAFLAGDS